jgi:hypothetical protein
MGSKPRKQPDPPESPALLCRSVDVGEFSRGRIVFQTRVGRLMDGRHGLFRFGAVGKLTLACSG